MALEFELKQLFQKSNYDCGHTCLEMLGYNGHEMFSGREMTSGDMRSIPGVREVTVPIGLEETLDYNLPHVWAILPKPRFATRTSGHFVIRYKEKIFCPRVGTVDSKEYKKKYVAFVMQEFLVPFNGFEL